MKEKQRARAGIAVPERAAETGTTYKTTSSSIYHNTTPSSGSQTGIASLLSRGAENGITLKHLEKMMGRPGREIRRQIELERRARTPILSDNRHGYFLPDSPKDIKRFVRSMRDRAKEIEAVAAAVEEAEL